MTPHTLRLLPGRATPSEVRLRFIWSIATSGELWNVAGAEDLDLARSVYVFVSILT